MLFISLHWFEIMVLLKVTSHYHKMQELFQSSAINHCSMMVSCLNQHYKFQATQAPFNSYCTIKENNYSLGRLIQIILYTSSWKYFDLPV